MKLQRLEGGDVGIYLPMGKDAALHRNYRYETTVIPIKGGRMKLTERERRRVRQLVASGDRIISRTQRLLLLRWLRELRHPWTPALLVKTGKSLQAAYERRPA